MTSSRRFSLVWRWSLSAMVLTAVFWGIWHLVTGSVPVVTSLQLTPDTAYELPLAISRWFDVVCAGIWTTLVVLIVTSESIRSDEDLTSGLAYVLAFGLAFGLAIGLLVGLDYDLALGLLVGLSFGLLVGLTLGLVFGLSFGPAFGLTSGLAYDLAVGLAFGLAVGLLVGLAFGLAVGLLVGLAFGLAIGLLVGLVYGLYHLFRRKTWYSIRDWYLAR